MAKLKASRRTCRCLITWMAAWLLICTIQSALAQTTISTGSIQGVISDPSGAVLRGAKVTILNKATGQSISATTNDAGAYVSGALAPGQYEVRVESTGFKTTVQSVIVQLNTTSTVNAKLSLGDSNQVVEVQAESVAVNTEQATVQGILNAQQIQNMPINGRNFMPAARLSITPICSYALSSVTAKLKLDLSRPAGTSTSSSIPLAMARSCRSFTSMATRSQTLPSWLASAMKN